MQTSLRGLAEIAGHEGIVLSPYLDSVGTWTYGVGHTRSAGPPNPRAMRRGERQPLEAALEVFRQDLKHHEDRVGRAVTVPLAQHEFDALVSFDFNTGGVFRAKLVKLLNDGDRAGAAEAFDGWHRPVEIIPRRNAEKRLFRDGVYLHGGFATIYVAEAGGRVDWGGGQRVNALELLAGRIGARQPDDPGAELRNDSNVDAGVGLVAAIGAGLLTLLTILGKLALWAFIMAALAGAAFLAWRYRDQIGRLFRRIAGRGQ